jgi:16S rRNA G1207 methylase RsmC
LDSNVEVLPPLESERLLVERLPETGFEHALVLSQGRAQLATELLRLPGTGQVSAWYMDLFYADLAQASVQASSSQASSSQGSANSVRIVCSADLPEDPLDAVFMPVSARSEAELTRDLLQQAHQRLITGGLFMTAVDNPRDQWLREQLSGMFEKVSCTDAPGGRVYSCRKTRPLKKVKNFEAEIVFRDEAQLIKLVSRPGVFSHRHVDPGARQLLQMMEIEPGQRVLDLGCGCGTIALAAALRAADVQVIAVDCNARAIACTQRGAELNGISALETRLNYDGQLGLDGTIDVVLANPPYYSDFAIADRMLAASLAALRPGGAVLLVNKHPQWYEERLPASFEDVAIFPSGKYWVACDRKP